MDTADTTAARLSRTVDSRIYTDQDYFRGRDSRRSWKKCLADDRSRIRELACPARFPYYHSRTRTHRYRARLRQQDRGVPECMPAPGQSDHPPALGSLTVAEPSGNANRMTCMFHAWQFDCFGRCVEIPRAKAGYQDRLKKEDVALTQFPCEVAHGGFVWLSLNRMQGRFPNISAMPSAS